MLDMPLREGIHLMAAPLAATVAARLRLAGYTTSSPELRAIQAWNRGAYHRSERKLWAAAARSERNATGMGR